MQRDVKVGLILGVILVAVVAVIFFRRDDTDRDKLAKLFPAPESIADRAKSALGSSPTDPYPVAPEYLVDSWQTPANGERTPTPRRTKRAESAEKDGEPTDTKSPAAHAILQPPEFTPPKQAARTKADTLTSFGKPSATDVAIHSGSSCEYTIQEGDTLISIAEEQLGDATLWPRLVAANSQELRDPNHIVAGRKIRIPDVHLQRLDTRSTASLPHQSPRAEKQQPREGVYEVKEGDSLMQIARRIYGDESKYRDIFDANRDQLEKDTDLRAGMVIRLPRDQRR